MLLKIEQGIDAPNCLNLVALQQRLLEVEQQLSQIVQTLDAQTINQLKADITPPKSMKEMFEFVPSEQTRETALQNLFTALHNACDFKRATAVAMMIPNQLAKNSALMELYKSGEALVLTHQFDEAIEIAMELPQGSDFPTCTFKGTLLNKISTALLQSGNIDRALEVAGMISRDNWFVAPTLANTYQDISKVLTEAENFERAIEVARMIPEQYTAQMRRVVLHSISQALAQTGNIARATEVANMIPNEDERNLALQNIPASQR